MDELITKREALASIKALYPNMPPIIELFNARRKWLEKNKPYLECEKAIMSLQPAKQETVTDFADRCRECGAKYGKLLKQKLSGDLISREAVCDYIAEFINHEYSTQSECEMVDGIQHMQSVKPQTGHWIRITNGGAMKQIYLCSVCHRQIEDDGIEALITIRYPYCHCGAKMEVEE